MERLVDLHVHLDGSLSLETVKELAARQGIEIQNDDILIKKLQVSKDCRDLNEYLTKFEYPLMLLQTIDSIEYAVYSLMKRQSEQNLLYSEIRFAPQLHTKKDSPHCFLQYGLSLNLLNLFRYTVVTSVWQVPVTA